MDLKNAYKTPYRGMQCATASRSMHGHYNDDFGWHCLHLTDIYVFYFINSQIFLEFCNLWLKLRVIEINICSSPVQANTFSKPFRFTKRFAHPISLGWLSSLKFTSFCICDSWLQKVGPNFASYWYDALQRNGQPMFLRSHNRSMLSRIPFSKAGGGPNKCFSFAPTTCIDFFVCFE